MLLAAGLVHGNHSNREMGTQYGVGCSDGLMLQVDQVLGYYREASFKCIWNAHLSEVLFKAAVRV